MGTLRLKETEAKYKKFIVEGGLTHECPLCTKEPIKEFTNWSIVNNDFPYDAIATVHHMIIPKRHASENMLTSAEWEEYQKIKSEYLHDAYEYLIEASQKKKSIPAHFHMHLVVAK